MRERCAITDSAPLVGAERQSYSSHAPSSRRSERQSYSSCAPHLIGAKGRATHLTPLISSERKAELLILRPSSAPSGHLPHPGEGMPKTRTPHPSRGVRRVTPSPPGGRLFSVDSFAPCAFRAGRRSYCLRQDPSCSGTGCSLRSRSRKRWRCRPFVPFQCTRGTPRRSTCP